MTGRYIVFESIAKAVLKPFEVPRPGAGEVLLENDYTVVSAGTERANLLNLPNTSLAFPYHPGYSGIGRVMAIGDGVENAEIGDRALANSSGHRSHAVQKAADLTIVTDESAESLDAAFVVIGAMGLQGVRKLKLELGESAMVIGLGILGVFATQLAVIDGAIQSSSRTSTGSAGISPYPSEPIMRSRRMRTASPRRSRNSPTTRAPMASSR